MLLKVSFELKKITRRTAHFQETKVAVDDRELWGTVIGKLHIQKAALAMMAGTRTLGSWSSSSDDRMLPKKLVVTVEIAESGRGI